MWARFRSRRGGRQQLESLEDLRATAPMSSTELVEAFDRLDALVREHLTLSTGINGQALTPAEVGRAVAQRQPSLAAADIEALLAACERARYAADLPTAEAWAGALQDAERILAAGSRRKWRDQRE
jgi:hypothetical protein